MIAELETEGSRWADTTLQSELDWVRRAARLATSTGPSRQRAAISPPVEVGDR